MTTEPNIKSLIKILVGVAWLDGRVQPEERQYLYRVTQAHSLAEDQELKPWLYELRAVTMTECYQWIGDYLGRQPTPERCSQLIEMISGLIYSDGEVASEEAKLVTRLLTFEQAQSEPQEFNQSVLNALRSLYQRWRDRRKAT
jgi:uncharacterized tellurite resistance protein B-like protein